MSMKIAAISFGMLVGLLAGCTQPIRPASTAHIGTERVFDKNYTIGQRQAAYVGQPVLKVKDYKVERFSSKKMRPSDDFVMSGGIVTVSGSKDANYDVIGETTLDGQTYTVVRLPGGRGGMGALVSADGVVHNKIVNDVPGQGSSVVMAYTFNISPGNLRFIPAEEEKRVIEAGYFNYELIYGGTDGKSITFTYREFTSQDLARPAFYQNLVYEAGKQQVRFRDTLLTVHEATNEKIVFTVVADSLAK